MHTIKPRTNILGDLRAEADSTMLDKTFYETPDYRTLIESAERIIVVGRRGTGKSALSYRLSKHWSTAKDTKIIKILPEEHHVYEIRPVLKKFGVKFNLIRAGSRLVWRYAFYMELADILDKHYKAVNVTNFDSLKGHINNWRQHKNAGGVITCIANTLKQISSHSQSPEDYVSALTTKLQIDNVQTIIKDALEITGKKFVVLIDQLDEGYEPDDVGIGFVDGLVQATIDIKTRLNNMRPTLFLRDNIFRKVANVDPDYSRNIEGHVLRLHWDEHQLFYFVCSRLRAAFNLSDDNYLRIWNHCVSNDLQGMDGFKKCLRLTLYRPRDLLALLNEAFYEAFKINSEKIVDSDIESTAKCISINRFNDLHKEYFALFPSSIEATKAFANKNPELTVKDATTIIENLLSQASDVPVQQDFLILEDAKEIIRTLYSIGFLGVHDQASNTFIFCHDGRNPDKEFGNDLKILIHPCYWMALNLTRNTLGCEEAQEINDEYEIEVRSSTPEVRKQKIADLIKKFTTLSEGTESANEFENWCLKAIRIAFAGSLSNVELHPNVNATQRRDVVATNLSTKGVWKRILDDYGSRQVVFEIKNYASLEQKDYRQMLAYLTGEYGKLGFIVCRDKTVEPQKNCELNWVREYHNHDQKVIIIKLTGKFMCDILDKLSSAQKSDYSDIRLNKLLDDYLRLYLSGQTASKRK